MRRRASWFALCIFTFVTWFAAIVFAAKPAVAQVNTATLTGTVSDPQGLAVRGAKVTATFLATDAERSIQVDDNGRFTLLGLVPGEYKVHVEGPANFAPYENPSLQLTVGQEAVLNVRLALGTQTQTVTVTTDSAPIETTRSESAQTVDQRQINNLPINGRNYINFTLTNSQVTRDVSPTIGPAPNSGLNISGARARSNMVSVDGADAVDNSINGIRATVSQEAVQEFQMILSNYNAEYGRATGGVVNIVTKSGSNDFHGDAFGFLRNKAFQARNPFSGEVNPATGNLDPVKQAYTRVQAGATLGGAIRKDKTFYFFSYEYTQREESGFSSIGENNFGLSPFTCGGCQLQGLLLTAPQTAAVDGLLQAAATAPNPALAMQYQTLAGNYATIMGSGSSVAVNRFDPGALVNALSGGSITPVNPVSTPAGVFFQEFPFPVACPAGQQVNALSCMGFARIGPNRTIIPAGAAPLPASFVGLNSIRGNFPVSEKTSLWSGRIDQRWSAKNSSFLRVGVSPSLVTGIEATSQNQVFGQNAGSRTGLNQSRDLSVTFQHDTIVSDTAFNEFRFQFARRGLHFGYSNLPGGSQIGVNIPGYAYFGREPYSTVDRIEKRYQFADSATVTHGRHTFKFGGDANLIQLRSSKQQIFQLDFGGIVNFGGLSASTFGLPDTVALPNGSTLALPGSTGFQSYGLGIPTTYIQGIGSSKQPFDNLPFSFFAQDSWRVKRNLTLNYGIRYDLEISPLFAPATPINAAAEKALGVIEGIPRDNKNIAPRFGLAWDPRGDGKTVIRAGYGLFYDHPLLAIAFDSVTADGGRSVQLISPGGSPSACGLIPGSAVCGASDTPTNLNGASIFQGVLNANSIYPAIPSSLTLGYLPDQQRFDPFAPNSLFANQNYLAAGFPLPILPFTLPVDKNFKYGYAQQANLTLERVIAGTWKISAGYQWTRGIHLNRPIDVNSTDPVLLTNNDAKAIAVGVAPPGASPLTVVLPSTPNGTCAGGIPVYNVPGAGSVAFASPTGQPLAPGVLGLGYTGQNCGGAPVGFIGTPAFFNYFRPSGPNPSFAGLVPGGYGTQVALAKVAGYPTGFGVPVPFNSVDTQKSDASSWYNALTINLTKSFSRHFTLLSSYTWSHSIDDGTDLQSTLEPPDSRFPGFERSNSVNDQRHRWVTSGVFQTSPHKSGDGLWAAIRSDFTFAPLFEVSTGRPFNVITGTDSRLDLGATQNRPSVVKGNGGTVSPFIHGVSFTPADLCLTNAGQPFTVPGVTPSQGCNGTLGRNAFTIPNFFQFDMRLSKGISLGERFRLDLIADAFNLFNHTNISAVNQLCDPSATSCSAGQPTAAYDARQFQFALKLNW
jgi:hypothetical protein